MALVPHSMKVLSLTSAQGTDGTGYMFSSRLSSSGEVSPELFSVEFACSPHAKMGFPP